MTTVLTVVLVLAALVALAIIIAAALYAFGFVQWRKQEDRFVRRTKVWRSK